MNEKLDLIRERASAKNALHGCSSDPCGSVVCQTARDRDALLSRLEQAERELVAVKSTQVQHIVKTSFEIARTAGIALDEAVKVVAGWLVNDPDRRAREAEQQLARVRAVCESDAYEVSNEFGDYDAVAVENILDALDGESNE